MSRRIRRSPRHPQVARKCIFCEDRNANSGEHLFPKWMHALLPRGPEGSYVGEQIDEHPKTRLVSAHWKATKPGELYTRKVKAVCASCNNGWMNQIEEQARPALTSIVTGQPITLDAEALDAVAKWATLKSIVSEHGDSRTAVTPQNDRTDLMVTAAIPSYFRIYLINHSSSAQIGFLRASQTVSRTFAGPNPPLNGMRKNVQQISFLLGKTMLLVNAARVSDFEIEDGLFMPAIVQRRIWPRHLSSISFPAPPIINDDQIRFLSRSMEHIMSQPNVFWGGHELPA